MKYGLYVVLAGMVFAALIHDQFTFACFLALCFIGAKVQEICDLLRKMSAAPSTPPEG